MLNTSFRKTVEIPLPPSLSLEDMGRNYGVELYGQWSFYVNFLKWGMCFSLRWNAASILFMSSERDGIF